MGKLNIKFVDALLYVWAPTLAPVLTGLKAGVHSVTDWLIIILGASMGLAGSLAAYRSTKYAEANFTLTAKPPSQ